MDDETVSILKVSRFAVHLQGALPVTQKRTSPSLVDSYFSGRGQMEHSGNVCRKSLPQSAA